MSSTNGIVVGKNTFMLSFSQICVCTTIYNFIEHQTCENDSRKSKITPQAQF